VGKQIIAWGARPAQSTDKLTPRDATLLAGDIERRPLRLSGGEGILEFRRCHQRDRRLDPESGRMLRPAFASR